jgi:cell division protein FtsQ
MQPPARVLARRRAVALVAAAAVCAVAAGVVEVGWLWLKGSSVFTLQSVAVRGGSEGDRVAARDAVARAVAGHSLLALSPAAVAGAIESVPTIRRASVDRDFPHTLRISIVPERPLAVAVGRGRYRSLVAASGRVLRVFAPSERLPSLPRLIWDGNEVPVAGGSLHAPAALAALDALAARPRGFRASIANVKVETERGIVMHLTGGLDVVLGPPIDLVAKLRSAAWVLRHYPTAGDRAQLEYADVSAPARPAVMPVGGYAQTSDLAPKKKKRDSVAKSAQNGA